MSCSTETSSWSGSGMSSTTKIVLAVLVGVALVFLFAWLLCPCPTARDDCHDRCDSDTRNCGWSGSGDDNCDENVKCIIVAPTPASTCHPSKRHYKDDNCGWSGTSDCGWSSGGNSCRRSPRKRHC